MKFYSCVYNFSLTIFQLLVSILGPSFVRNQFCNHLLGEETTLHPLLIVETSSKDNSYMSQQGIYIHRVIHALAYA